MTELEDKIAAIQKKRRLDEAKRGWLLSGSSVLVLWVGSKILSTAEVLPVVLVSAILFVPIILLVLGLIYTGSAWRKVSQYRELFVDAVVGTITGAVGIFYLVDFFVDWLR